MAIGVRVTKAAAGPREPPAAYEGSDEHGRTLSASALRRGPPILQFPGKPATMLYGEAQRSLLSAHPAPAAPFGRPHLPAARQAMHPPHPVQHSPAQARATPRTSSPSPSF